MADLAHGEAPYRRWSVGVGCVGGLALLGSIGALFAMDQMNRAANAMPSDAISRNMKVLVGCGRMTILWPLRTID